MTSEYVPNGPGAVLSASVRPWTPPDLKADQVSAEELRAMYGWAAVPSGYGFPPPAFKFPRTSADGRGTIETRWSRRQVSQWEQQLGELGFARVTGRG